MFKRILPTVVTMLVGLIVLVSYLLPVNALVQLRSFVLSWAMGLTAFALLVACASVLRVHLVRLFRAKKNKMTSFLVILSGGISLIIVAIQGVTGPLTRQLLDVVLVPGESALLALTAVTLVVSGMRVLNTRRSAEGIIFVLTAVFILLTTVAYKVYPNGLTVARQFVDAVATSGMRGILMGVALGVTLTGLRIVLGIDQPHSDEG